MTDNITGLDLQVAKGCDNNGHFDQDTAPGNQISIIARKTYNKVDDDDEKNITEDKKCVIRPVLYGGKDILGDAYVTLEPESSKTTAVGGFPGNLTPRQVMQQYDGSISKVLDAILYPNATSKITAPTIALKWAGDTIVNGNKTVTLDSASNTYVVKTTDFVNVKTPGSCTYASTTSTGVPVDSLALGKWKNADKFYYSFTSELNDRVEIKNAIAFNLDSTGMHKTIKFSSSDVFLPDEIYARNKKGDSTSRASYNVNNKAGLCTLNIYAPCVYVAVDYNLLTNKDKGPSLNEAINFLNSNGERVEYKTWGDEALGTSYIEKGSKYVETTVPDSQSNYYRIWAVPSAYTCQSYVQSDNINDYTNVFKLIGVSELVKGASGVVYNIYYKTTADSSAPVKINAYYK